MCPDSLRVELAEFRADAGRYVGYAQVGSTVVVQSDGVAIAHLVPPPGRTGRFPWGKLAGKITVGAEFDDDAWAGQYPVEIVRP